MHKCAQKATTKNASLNIKIGTLFFFLFEYSSHILFVTLMNGLNYSGSLLDFGNGFKLERKYSWSKLNWSLKQPSQGVGDNLHERGLGKRLEINFDLMVFFFFQSSSYITFISVWNRFLVISILSYTSSIWLRPPDLQLSSQLCPR